MSCNDKGSVCNDGSSGIDDSNSLSPLLCYSRGRGTDKRMTVVCVAKG